MSHMHRRSPRSSCIFSQGFETVSPIPYLVAISVSGRSPPPIHIHTNYRPPPPSPLLPHSIRAPPTLGTRPLPPHSLESYSARFCDANLYPTMDRITTCRGSSPPPNLIPHHQSRLTTHQTENIPAVSPRNLPLLNCCNRFLVCLAYHFRAPPTRLISISNLRCLSLVPVLGCRLFVRFFLSSL